MARSDASFKIPEKSKRSDMPQPNNFRIRARAMVKRQILAAPQRLGAWPHLRRLAGESLVALLYHRIDDPGRPEFYGFRDNVIGWFVFDVVITAVEKEVHHQPWSSMRDFFHRAGLTDVRHRKFNYWFPTLLTMGTT